MADAIVDAIIEAIEEHIASTHSERGDEAHAHVGDLGFCKRQTHARRSGKRMGKFDTETLWKFWSGLMLEKFVAEAVGKRMEVLRDVRIAMWPGPGRIDAKIVGEEYVPLAIEMIGHPDGVTQNAVIEVKSTEFFKQQKPPYARILPTIDRIKNNQQHYVYQTAAYALALQKPHAILVVVDRASLKYVVFRFDPRDAYKDVRDWMIAVLADTEPGQPEPAPRPPKQWMCAYCRYYDCKENVNPNNEKYDRAHAV